MNTTLAKIAENGVHSGPFEQQKGFCLRTVRQWAEKVPGIGTKYDALFRGNGTNRDATASRAGRRFLAAGLGFRRADLEKHGGLQPGDILVKETGAPNRWGDDSGHIGVLLADLERLAENSSTSRGRVRGALGFRSLKQFGNYDIVIRLPDPKAKQSTPKPETKPAPKLEIIIAHSDGGVLKPTRLPLLIVGGVGYAPVAAALKAAGVETVRGKWADGTIAIVRKD